ncbi:MAG: hypothetical protein CK530_01020 [Planctomycetaceae bacterium]|nr:MAG: hypothetical protein CK530_01020 [Planctomycetaceae bacterium]
MMAPQLLQHLQADAHWSPRYKRTAWMTLGPVLVVGLLVPVSAAEPVFKQLEVPATDQPVQLEYHFRSGERINTEVAHRALTETTIGGTTQSTDTATDSTKTWLVVSVDSEGRATLEHSVDGVTMTSRTSDRGQVRWSSRDNQPPPPGYEGVKQSLGVPLARLVVDRTGRVIERQDLRPSPPSNTGDLVVVPLPDEAVVVGAEWTVPQEVVVEVPNGPRKAVRTRLRYQLEGVHDGIATICVDTTVLTPLDDPRLEARLLERIWDGTIIFDIARGRVIRRTTGIDRRVVGFSGPESSLRYKASLEERLIEQP